MSVLPPRFTRFIVALMCLLHAALGVAGSFASHGESAAHGYLCGAATPAAVAALADKAPEVFAEAYRQLTGAGEDCCGGCPACSPAIHLVCAARAGIDPVLSYQEALTVLRGAPRSEVHKPPSTAPPDVS